MEIKNVYERSNAMLKGFAVGVVATAGLAGLLMCNLGSNLVRKQGHLEEAYEARKEAHQILEKTYQTLKNLDDQEKRVKFIENVDKEIDSLNKGLDSLDAVLKHQ